VTSGDLDVSDLNVSYQIREQVAPLLLLDSMSRLAKADVAPSTM
jgi:hypothetical protein